MILSREAIQRMITDEIGGGGGGAGISGSALANLLTGYATQDWVGENYISIEFFSRLFQAHGTENGQQTDIDPNDMDSTITSIESMFGFWTDYYLSALGNGGGLGSTLYLSTLADVLISSPANNQVLTYNATIGKWVNANAQAGVTQLSALTDVTLTTPSANQVLIYDSTNQRWINTSLKTINYQSIIGSGDISVGGGASGNYLPLTGGTVRSNYSDASVEIGNVASAITTMRISYGAGYGVFIGSSKTSGSTYLMNVCNGITNTGGGGAVSKFYIAANGFVGINTESPQYTLDINGNTRHSGTITLDDSCYFMGAPSFGFRFNDHNSNYNNFIIYENGNTYTRGKVGIASMNPSFTLTLHAGVNNWASCIYNSGSTVLFSHGGGYGAYLGVSSTSASNYIVDFRSGITIQDDGTPQGGSSRFTVLANGNVGISTDYPSYSLHVVGNIYATGAVTALSDIRKKDVLSTDIGLTVEQIADAPTIKFLWKDRRNEGIQVGSVAQFWAANLPEVVMERGGELSMQYGVAALVSAIITARKVVDHERRISELEKENERLRTEVEQLRLN